MSQKRLSKLAILSIGHGKASAGNNADVINIFDGKES